MTVEADWDDLMRELEKDRELNREERNKIEPVEDALRYTVVALSSDDVYFDPVHAARLRDGDQDSRPLSEIVDMDFRDLPEIEEEFWESIRSDPMESTRMRRGYEKTSLELKDHLEKGELVQKMFSVDAEDYDTTAQIERIKNGGESGFQLFDRISSGEDVGDVDMPWRVAAVYTKFPYDWTVIRSNSFSQGADMEEGEMSKTDPENTVEFLDRLGYDEFNGIYLPPEPDELGREIMEDLVEQYRRTLDSIDGGEDDGQAQESTYVERQEKNRVDRDMIPGDLPVPEKDLIAAGARYNASDEYSGRVDRDLLRSMILQVRSQRDGLDIDRDEFPDPRQKNPEAYGELRGAVEDIVDDPELKIGMAGNARQLDRLLAGIEQYGEDVLYTETEEIVRKV